MILKDSYLKIISTSIAALGIFLLMQSLIHVRTKTEQHYEKLVDRQTSLIVRILERNIEDRKKQDKKINELESKIGILSIAANQDDLLKERIEKVKQVLQEELNKLPTKLDVKERAQVAYNLIKYCDEYEVPAHVFLGLIRQESAFNPRAESWQGAQGLSQILPSTSDDIKQWIGTSRYNPFSISHSIRFGTRYFSRLLDIFNGDIEKSTMAYHAGPNAVLAHIKAKECIEHPEEDKKLSCPNLDQLEKLAKMVGPLTLEYREKVLGFANYYKEQGVH